MTSNSSHEVSSEQEIGQITVGKPHVVILGAGASIASVAPFGRDNKGRILPAMNNLIEVVGLEDLLRRAGVPDTKINFEVAYDSIDKTKFKNKVGQINKKIFDYFDTLELPSTPTIYDYLVLSLRRKDLIATFNWDPFLMQAYRRNKGKVDLPQIAFLHGNVTVGSCSKDRISGINGHLCSKCSKPFIPSKLLYPISRKDYSDDEFIENEWKRFRLNLKRAFMVTVFGYSAPKTDTEAIEAMKKAWGKVKDRNMEQFEMITKPKHNKESVRKTWDDFIHSHHYRVHGNYYDSFIANHPRRTGEAYWNQNLEAKFIENNPIPKNISFRELWGWLEPLRRAEIKTSS